MLNNNYKEALKNANKENKVLRKTIKDLNKKLDKFNNISEKKDNQLESALEQIEEYEEKLKEMRQDGGGIVGKVTQTLNKYKDSDLLTE